MSTNEPTAAQTETRKCVATKNRFGHLMMDECGGPEWHQTRESCASTEALRQSCAHHDPAYLPEAEPVPSVPEQLRIVCEPYRTDPNHRRNVDSGQSGCKQIHVVPEQPASETERAMCGVIDVTGRCFALRPCARHDYPPAPSTGVAQPEPPKRETIVFYRDTPYEVRVSGVRQPEPAASAPNGYSAFLLTSKPGEVWAVTSVCPEHKNLGFEGRPFTRTVGPIHPCRKGCVYERVVKPRKNFDELLAEMSPESRARVDERATEMLRELDAADPFAELDAAIGEMEFHASLSPSRVTARSIAAEVRAAFDRLRGTATTEAPNLYDAAKTLVFAMHIYPNYRMDSRGPRGCIADALQIIAPDVLAEVQASDWSTVYERRWSEEAASVDANPDEPSAPTGRDPDCPYCVRNHPDERCTCVPSRNAPSAPVAEGVGGQDNTALVGEFDATVWAREFCRLN